MKQVPKNSGFTIVELLVAISLFSVLVTIGVGGVVTALRTQRQAAALLALNNSLGLTMEQMLREMRTGRDFCLPAQGNDCPPGQTGVAFTNSNNEHVRYCFNSPNGSTAGSITRGTDPSNAPNCNTNVMAGLTPPSVNLTNAAFTVSGNLPGDGSVPRVVINITGATTDPTLTGVTVNLETLVSARFNLGNN
ncbi:MAG TPA: type II secretion system protein [Candidatus Paceibacterota bacterium]|nr:type II secretion system protein [Candidatus Paceibacterota bacterium]